MVALIWETALLLLGAYFLGAFSGCMIRRLFFPASLDARVVAPAASAATVAASSATDDTARFERALAGREDEPAQPASAPVEAAEPQPPAEPVAPKIEPIASGLSDASDRPQPSDGLEAVVASAAAVTAAASAAARQDDEAAKFEREPEPQPEPEAPADLLPPEEVLPPRETMGDVANRHAEAWSSTKLLAVDDFEDIEGVDADLAQKLAQAGVIKFGEIAGWTTEDVTRFSTVLAVGDAISRQNWIEQASLLASGRKTAFAERRARGAVQLSEPTDDSGVRRLIQREVAAGIDVPGAEAPAAPEPPVAQPEPDPEPEPDLDADLLPAASGTADGATVAARIETIELSPPSKPERETSPGFDAGMLAAAAAAATVVSAGTSSDAASSAERAMPAADAARIGDREDLTVISGVNPEIAQVLHAHGVIRVAQIAGWSPADVQRFDGLLGSARIAREDWVGQARRLTGLTSDAGAATGDASGARANLQALRSVRSSALVGPEGAFRPDQPDDLKRIRGIGILLERRLNGLGVITYSQIASWSADEASRVGAELGLGDQVSRENWVDQARLLAFEVEGDSDWLDDEGVAADPVRSTGTGQAGASAALGASAAAAAAVAASAAAIGAAPKATAVPPTGAAGSPRPGPGASDDLKRIRGIGILIERKLLQLGVTSYEEIANWTASDIERVNAVLDFNGRIERENWIEQARILATGGQTEFSRRLDRGEV